MSKIVRTINVMISNPEKISQAAPNLGVTGSSSREENARAAVEAVRDLIVRVMGGNVLADVTADHGMLTLIVRDCLEDPVISNTPRMPSFAQVEGILQDAVHGRVPHPA